MWSEGVYYMIINNSSYTTSEMKMSQLGWRNKVKPGKDGLRKTVKVEMLLVSKALLMLLT